MKQLASAEILEVTINTGINKANLSFRKMIILGVLAGIFIALAGAGANMASYYFLAVPQTAGIGKAIAGLLFTSGLIMVVLAGGELFTGNCLMLASALDKKISLVAMLRNWIIVFISNMVGAMFVAWVVAYSGLLNTGDGLLETVTVNIAASKCSLDFGQAFFLGILCNLLVCIAVWMASGSDSTIGKIFAIFFPIWLFVTSGYEHSVANMYFIPAGLFAKGATEILNWESFFIDNLLPVTLGNIVGGSIFVAAAYYFAYKKA